MVPERGLGMRPRRPQDTAQLADLRHHLRGGQPDVEVDPTSLDLLYEVVLTHVIGPGLPGNFTAVGAGEHEHPHGLADAVGQADDATHHLVGMAGGRRWSSGETRPFRRIWPWTCP